MITISHAIKSLRPNVEWVMYNNDIENIIWHTPNVEPLTQEEVQAEIIRLEQEEENARVAKIQAKESAIAKLSALGLNEDEVNAIIGGIS